MPGTEWESDYEKIAKSLKGISMTASRGADPIRRFEEVELCPTELAQLKEMVKDAVRRGGGTLP